MSTSLAQALGSPGGVATGHVPQQPNMGLGPNRYVPPTFNWGRGNGGQPNYQQMDWNQMQAFYMPQHTNSPFTNPYMQQLQGMLGQFSAQYGSPNRQPVLPQFGSYNPGFGGPTSFYDQMRGGTGGQGSGGFWGNYGPEDQEFGGSIMPVRGGGGDHALPEGYSYNAPEGSPGADYFRNLFGEGGGMGGGMYGREYDRRAAYEHARQQPDFDWENYGESMDGPRMPYGGNGGGFGGRGGGGSDPYAAYLEYQQNNPNGTDPGFNIGGPGQRAATLSREQYSQWLRDTASGMYDNMYPDPYTGRGGGTHDQFAVMPGSGPGPGADYFRSLFGGSGGRGGYPTMPQFNPYMLARNNMMGMDFNEMFDPRFAMLFGMGGLGSMRPQGFAATQPQQPPSTANGQKPLAIGGGG